MCKLMEDRLDEREYNRNIQIVIDMLTKNKYSYDEIADISKLSLSDVEEIAKQLETAKAQ